MNKLKFILAAGIAAALTLSCSDDSSGDDTSSSSGKDTSISSSSGGGNNPGISSSGGVVILPDSWDNSGTVTLGNGNNGSAGSFLDADSYPLVAISKSGAAAKKNVIDLVLTGSSFYTPAGCAGVAFCSTEMNGGNEDAVFINVPTSSLSATSTPDDVIDALQGANDDDFENGLVVSNNGKYIMFTDRGTAYIIVNGAVGNNVTLTVGWIAD